MTLSAAYNSLRQSEVTFSATVSSDPNYFYGTHTHCMHEEFDAQTSAGPVDVIDNVALAPRVPVKTGDQIQVRGEMVHDPGRIPVVHWTHHDPARTHEGGFIRVNGRTYA